MVMEAEMLNNIRAGNGILADKDFSLPSVEVADSRGGNKITRLCGRPLKNPSTRVTEHFQKAEEASPRRIFFSL